jgi:hypothetical protein
LRHLPIPAAGILTGGARIHAVVLDEIQTGGTRERNVSDPGGLRRECRERERSRREYDPEYETRHAIPPLTASVLRRRLSPFGLETI